MERELTHEEVQELLGAYAIDAVTGAERDAVDRHLHECARCRGELAEHRETAAFLAHGAPAPAGVWQRISGAISGEPPNRAMAPLLRRSVFRGQWRVAAGAAAVTALVAGILGIKVIQQEDRIDELGEAVRLQSMRGAAFSAAADPLAARIPLVATDGSTVATVALLPDGTGYFMHSSLRHLSPKRTYQLWALAGEAVVSAGVVGNAPGVMAFRVDLPVDGFAITVERRGGVPVPRKAPLASGRIATS
jgi:anti-sigma-K factor RskA